MNKLMIVFSSFFISITIVFAWIAGSFLYGDTQDLNPMEVSALRLETSDKNLPARIQVIDQAKIEQSSTTDIVGLLRKSKQEHPHFSSKRPNFSRQNS